jgi:hypothetical protein
MELINRRLSQGVNRKNNSFVGIARTMPKDLWPSRSFERKTFDKLGVAMPNAQAERFVTLQSYSHDVFTGLYDETKEPWLAKQNPELAKWLEGNKAVLAEVASAVRKPNWYVPLVMRDEQKLLGVTPPYLSYLRKLTRAFAARSQRRIANNNVEKAWEDILTILRLSRHVSRGPYMISYLVSLGIVNVAAEAYAGFSRVGGVRSQAARDMLKDLHEIRDLSPVSARIDLEGRYVALSNTAYLLETGIVPEGRETIKKLLSLSQLDHGDLDVKYAKQRVNAIIDRAVEAAAAPSWALSKQKIEQLRQEFVVSVNDDAEDIQQKLRKVQNKPAGQRPQASTRIIVDLMMSSQPITSKNVIRTSLAGTVYNRLLPLSVALEGYRSKHGSYPRKLDALTPGWLDKIPRDPFVDRRLHYRHQGRNVAVYSVGPDQSEDGEDDNMRDDWVIELGPAQ